MLAVESLNPDQKERGVVACSGGNFALAVSYVANQLGVPATVVMPSSASLVRQEGCKKLGAQVFLESDIGKVFDTAQLISKNEGKEFLHPFEGRDMTLGAASMAYEYLNEFPQLDVLVAAIGGGGMASGVSLAAKLINPSIKVYGVEPRGANTMHLSFESGKPEKIDRVDTIADSLGSPRSEPFSLSLCQNYLDRLVYVEESEMIEAMRILFHHHSFAVEPACAAGLGSLLGSLKVEVREKKVGLFLCGSNIDFSRFQNLTS